MHENHREGVTVLKQGDKYECAACRSSWPAMTTIEAYHNYGRANIQHPGKRCYEVTNELHGE